ncbi:MAG: hypothetical protein QNJ31_01180 [Candidatus Caenarcaniphilales bacterium]|nr:hypothetical protein [Candidatus Caenarcaniphilales bacterium]
MSEHHNPSFWQILLESNFLNFAVFAGFIYWFFTAKLPIIVKQKNNDIESELRQSIERCRLAEEQLAFAEKELSVFRSNAEKMKQDSQSRIQSLKQELENDKQEAVKKLQNRYEKEIIDLKATMKKQFEQQISLKSMEIAEKILKEQSDYTQLNKAALEETIDTIEKNPNLLKVN